MERATAAAREREKTVRKGRREKSGRNKFRNEMKHPEIVNHIA